MPDDGGIETSSRVGDKEPSFSLLLQQVIGKDSLPITEKQVDEVLSQRRQIHELMHKDKQRESLDKRFYFFATLLASLIVIILVLFFAKQFLTQVLSLIIGGIGGYGLGRSQR